MFALSGYRKVIVVPVKDFVRASAAGTARSMCNQSQWAGIHIKTAFTQRVPLKQSRFILQ